MPRIIPPINTHDEEKEDLLLLLLLFRFFLFNIIYYFFNYINRKGGGRGMEIFYSKTRGVIYILKNNIFKSIHSYPENLKQEGTTGVW